MVSSRLLSRFNVRPTTYGQPKADWRKNCLVNMSTEPEESLVRSVIQRQFSERTGRCSVSKLTRFGWRLEAGDSIATVIFGFIEGEVSTLDQALMLGRMIRKY